jgi:hypothetical protein
LDLPRSGLLAVLVALSMVATAAVKVVQEYGPGVISH